MTFAALEGQRVAVWGAGREGRAALAALRQRLPGQALTLFCRPGEADDLAAMAELTVRVEAPDAQALSAFDVVIKSPGISAYKPELLDAQAQGTRFTSGTALWFGERADARVIGVTGTKGKSTVSALLAHLARSLRVRTALAGNIGLPLLELLDGDAALWVTELSSFQTGEAGPLELGVITSLYEEHLDWHGSRERYVADKLKLADAARTLLVNATQPDLLARTAAHPRRVVFGATDGWHVADGGLHRGASRLFEVADLPLPGAHNALNACAALTALEQVGLDAEAALPALRTFHALPHRLQPLGARDGLRWINDSISTTPQAALAALDSLPRARTVLILGGHDRGLDWHGFAEALRDRPPHAVVVQGANRARVLDALRVAGYAASLIETDTLESAVDRARETAPVQGVVLLSPGAPSFDQFRDYTERGRRFAALAGFDAARIASIEGLGIA
ncbi:UDP-N-acetylmuramoyl-L-alanine--D-glutamate ligase [Oleiagrimonas soli]|nr:UDP-N-acetylmuramoyl-L-alanine--D-glutamate ligase [Oleiagrimonas soli]KGI77306.1 UDP-N-acetylmuramoylalanine ligase [Oleiagrimonas soli]